MSNAIPARRALLAAMAMALVTQALGSLGCAKRRPSDESSSTDSNKKKSAKEAPAPAKRTVLAASKWKKDDRGVVAVTIDGRGNDLVKINDDMTTDLEWSGSDGNVVRIAGVRAEIDDGKAVTKIALTAPLFEAVKSWKHKGEWYDPIELAVEVPFTSSEADKPRKLSLKGGELLGWYLEQTVMRGKAALAPDEAVTTEGKGYLTYYPDKRHLHIQPTATGWTNARLVVVSEYLGVDERECGVYHGEKTGKEQRVSISLVKRRVTVVERRTGKVRAERTFKGAGSCPAKVDKTYKIYYPDDDAMAAFIKSNLV